ncbi:hypothetical protein, conserved [Babesia ovata]|uniref:Uncharacterized protein n=1 Tax=Babesia ovata TaxID=189622 RepID=A0A2H6KDF1_9APIC|nr:uncharacterized protein BOVATA_025100 [Babesia ovata]GBE61017.1 hypothetical protein, conserved [Babesia ovata]
MVYDLLTTAPRNLKEGIDWLMALKGTDAENNLKAMGAAVYDFLADKPVGKMKVRALEDVKVITKEFLEKQELRGRWFVKKILRKINEPIGKTRKELDKHFRRIEEYDYKNIVMANHLTAEKITQKLGKVVDCCEKFLEKIKSPDEYKSAYSSGATWDASCAEDPEACAVVLVGIAPMLYAGIRSVWEESKAGSGILSIYGEGKPMGNVLKAMGYEEPQYRAGMGASYVLRALGGVKVRVLGILYDIAGFWAFY